MFDRTRWLRALSLIGMVGMSVLTSAATGPSLVADAAQAGDREAVKALLKQAADVNGAQGDGMTALHWAAQNNDVDLVQMLLYAGANAKATTRINGYTPLLLAAKAAVFGAMSLAVGEAASFLAFFAGGAAFRHGIPAPALSQPGAARAVVLGGASYCLIGLIGLGLGAIIRHTAAAIAVLVVGVYLIAQIVGAATHAVAAYMPIFIIGNSLTTTRPELCTGAGQCLHFLSAWAGLGVAVANAHPLVLQAAGDVTLSNDQDGVAHMLERLLEQM